MMIILTCFWNTAWSIIAPPPGLLFTVLSSITTPPLPKPQRRQRIQEQNHQEHPSVAGNYKNEVLRLTKLSEPSLKP
ncbi:hypothetical protein HanXRQr2_Chr17g0807571 [Helianthus annuus]|uniref:Uncharacterized protein n=1 Tax=Helianthus annuus TaxID=4232 RepID=A0A9K3GUX0_HELAN|nr:hypothetical protein HanXRQr2_Chr17g0807571 [Helianthus annuus]